MERTNSFKRKTGERLHNMLPVQRNNQSQVFTCAAVQFSPGNGSLLVGISLPVSLQQIHCREKKINKSDFKVVFFFSSVGLFYLYNIPVCGCVFWGRVGGELSLVWYAPVWHTAEKCGDVEEKIKASHYGGYRR